MLHGYLYMPQGQGPFPSVIWNHGSGTKVRRQDKLGNFYTSNGFIFFMPHRHGHGRSPGKPILELQDELKEQHLGRDEFQRGIIGLHELYLKDTLAAADWLRKQPDVDPMRLIMSGVSYGGIQTVLAAEADAGMKAYVPFAPGAMSWKSGSVLHERLLRAVKNAKAPMFLLQAQNDYSLGPSELLGAELNRKGVPNRAKVYLPFGQTNEEGHAAFATRGMNLWGDDAMKFIGDVLKP